MEFDSSGRFWRFGECDVYAGGSRTNLISATDERRWMRYFWICIFLLCPLAKFSFAQPANDDGLVFFEQKIRPVLVQHCYSCHSVEARDLKKLQGALYLDSAEGISAGGESGPVLEKGKSAESRLIKALKYDGTEMPPSGKLPEEVVADFAKWIDMGAPDPRHSSAAIKPKREINIDDGKQWWSFRPLRIVVPPAVEATSRIRTPIDAFIADAWTKHQLKAAPAAGKEKLIRRAYFDLTGLPPTPEQIDAFLSDSSDKAFERVVDTLLDSPRYGEKWGRHWLDVARFAESGGYEFDGFRPGAYHYRDWVIRAFNDDMPYDQFVRMQLAGDKLNAEDYRAASASGFLVAGPYPGQTTSKTIEGIRYDQLDDMLMTIGGSMLGLTLGCARCHEHKFDPIPHKDYYALASSLAQTVHGTRFIDPNPEATLQNWERYRAAHDAKVAALKTFAAEQLPQRFESWKATEIAKLPDARRWQVMEPTAVSADRSWLRWFPAGIITCESTLNPGTVFHRRGQRHVVPDSERFSINLETFQKNITALRLDAFTDKSLPNTGPGLNGEGRFHVRELKVIARPLDANSTEKPQELKLKPIVSAFQDDDEPLTNAVDGKADTTWGGKSTAKKDNAAIFELEPPLAGFASGTELQVEMTFVDRGIGRFRFSISTEPTPITWAGDLVPQHASEIRAILAANGNQLPAAQRESMVRWFSAFDPETASSPLK